MICRWAVCAECGFGFVSKCVIIMVGILVKKEGVTAICFMSFL